MDAVNLKSFSLFNELTEAELQTILKLGCEVPFKQDELIIRQGQAHSSMFFVVHGVLHVNRHVDASNVFLGRLEKGSFFGEIGLFDPGVATATIRAMGAGMLYEVKRENFFTLLDQQPAIGCKLLKAMMQEMSKRLRRVDQRLGSAMYWEGLSKPKE